MLQVLKTRGVLRGAEFFYHSYIVALSSYITINYPFASFRLAENLASPRSIDLLFVFRWTPLFFFYWLVELLWIDGEGSLSTN